MQVIFFPSSPKNKDPSVTRRAMDIYNFMNSKTLFTVVRKDPTLRQRLPVLCHVNFHPNKHERMLAIVKYFVDKQLDALDPFPDGSE